VEITYEICNDNIQYDLILDQEKTQLMYDSTDITPTSIFVNPIAPDECVKFVHEVTWDMCDVVRGDDDTGERVFPYSIEAEGFLGGDPPSKGKGGSKGKGKGKGKGGSKGKGSKSSKSSKSKGGSKGGSKGKGSKSSKSSKSKGGGGMKGGMKVIVEPHRHEGIFIARGKEDALVTLNSTPGVAVYGEKRISKGGSKGKGSKSSKSSKSKGGKGSGRRDLQSNNCSCKLIDANSLCQLSKFPMCSLFLLFYNYRQHFPSFLIHI